MTFLGGCAGDTRSAFDIAMAEYYALDYGAAARRFADISRAQPECAMAWWGQALATVWPLEGVADAATLARGRRAIEKASQLKADGRRAAAHIEALTAYFDTVQRAPQARAGAYLERLRRLRDELPDDPDVAVLYGAMLMAGAPAGVQARSRQAQTIGVLQEVHAAWPDHPGAAHYLALASEAADQPAGALGAARDYHRVTPQGWRGAYLEGRLAASVGLWDQALPALRVAARVSALPADKRARVLDALVDAALQSCRDGEAAATNSALAALPTGSNPGAAYAKAAARARLVLTRGQWGAAAALVPVGGPAAQALAYYGRAVGALRAGDVGAAQAASAALDRLAGAADPNYGIGSLAAAAQGALAQARGDTKSMQAHFSRASLSEATRGSWPPSPYPAGILVGGTLLRAGQPGPALAAYDAELSQFPNRRLALVGAAQAALALRDADRAAAYYARLSAACPEPDGSVPELVQARAFLRSPVLPPLPVARAVGAPVKAGVPPPPSPPRTEPLSPPTAAVQAAPSVEGASHAPAAVSSSPSPAAQPAAPPTSGERKPGPAVENNAVGVGAASVPPPTAPLSAPTVAPDIARQGESEPQTPPSDP